jgi:hypothetical protein
MFILVYLYDSILQTNHVIINSSMEYVWFEDISSMIFSVNFVTNHLEPIISDGSVAAKKNQLTC